MTLNRLFEFELIDQKTFEGIEREIINKFFMLSIKHYANVDLQPEEREKFIDRKEYFFEAFGDQLRWYKKMKTKFQNFDKSEVFNKHFMVPELEDQLS